ncbi:MAG TPA: hypothetical protein VGQ52_00225 [Gemmatimonadaceae bacterium]|jgi:hypothetical protein|nr:hypothetical protein [Gemmatimonadaceae bacterium]
MSIAVAIAFLNELGRPELAALLKYSGFEFYQEEIWDDLRVQAVKVISPPVFTEALESLDQDDKKRVLEAIIAAAEEPANHVSFESTKQSELSAAERLLAEIWIQRDTMIDVATGGRRIQEVNDYYRARARRIQAGLKDIGLEDPNPHADLWDWYNTWSAKFGTYVERRRYVTELYQPIFDKLLAAPPPAVPPREPTGWERVDRTLDKANQAFSIAKNAEDFQAVGLLCREAIISIGQAVYDPATHKTPDGVVPSATDGGRMIEAYLVTALAGGSNEKTRKHARASLELAVELQHKRTADFRAAAMCLEATSSLINLLAILSGRRDRRH